jgi:hypothetical protein
LITISSPPPKTSSPVAAVEQREAASEDEILASSVSPVYLHALPDYDRFAVGRSLALLDSCYKKTFERPKYS